MYRYHSSHSKDCINKNLVAVLYSRLFYLLLHWFSSLEDWLILVLVELILHIKKKLSKAFTILNISLKWNALLLACSVGGDKILSMQNIFNLNWANMRRLLFKVLKNTVLVPREGRKLSVTNCTSALQRNYSNFQGLS